MFVYSAVTSRVTSRASDGMGPSVCLTSVGSQLYPSNRRVVAMFAVETEILSTVLLNLPRNFAGS